MLNEFVSHRKPNPISIRLNPWLNFKYLWLAFTRRKLVLLLLPLPLIVLQRQQIGLPAKFHGDALTINGHYPGAIDTIPDEERATID